MEKLQITLAAARVNAGLTQEQAAQKMGITKQTVSNWEKGSGEPKISQARQLSNIYGVPLDDIFFKN